MAGKFFSREEAESKKNKKLRSTEPFGAMPSGSVATVIQAEQAGSQYLLKIQWHLPHIKSVVTDSLTKEQYFGQFMELRDRAVRPEEVESKVIDSVYLASLDFLNTLPTEMLEMAERVSKEERVEALYFALKLGEALTPEQIRNYNPQKVDVPDHMREKFPLLEQTMALGHGIATVLPKNAEEQIAKKILDYLSDLSPEQWTDIRVECQELVETSQGAQDPRVLLIHRAANLVKEQEEIQARAS